MIPLIREQKHSTPLVEIYMGSLSVFVTTSKSPVEWGGNRYLPEPALDVDLPKQSGALAEEVCTVTLPRSSLHAGVAAVAEVFGTPRSAPPTRVRVIELLQSAAEETTPVFLYDGIVDRSTRNPENVAGIVKLEIQPEWRLQLGDITLGRRADATCDHVWGGLGCGVDTDIFWSLADAANQLAVRKVNVTCMPHPEAAARQVDLFINPTLHPGGTQAAITRHPVGWWKGGFLEKDGLRIAIADWKWNTLTNHGTSTFVLNRIPPKSWDGAEMVLHPGCSRTPEACTQRQGNTLAFGGLGWGIPAYNPTIDRSGS